MNRMVKQVTKKLAWHLVCFLLGGDLEGKRSFERPRRGWDDDIKIDDKSV